MFVVGSSSDQTDLVMGKLDGKGIPRRDSVDRRYAGAIDGRSGSRRCSRCFGEVVSKS